MKSSDYPSSRRETLRNTQIEQFAHELVDMHHHFHRRAGEFEFRCEEDVLIVRGSVPTFYLKQMLQIVLRDLDGIRTLDNRVKVISSQGLSGLSRD